MLLVTQYCIGSLGDIMQLKKQQNKTKPKKSHNPKIKIELLHSNNNNNRRPTSRSTNHWGMTDGRQTLNNYK